jgi:hypothetical protein
MLTLTPQEKNGHIIYGSLSCCSSPVFSGFLAEYQLEHKIEKERAEKFLQSMLLDVRTNIVNLDSLMKQDRLIISNHDALVNWLLQDSATINRGAFAKSMGAVWVRNFWCVKKLMNK